ncbi:SDR family oxidoreductase [bacterium]|nr:SDR family oxidoreductase [bacterium]MDB4770494.1 SDR family oxidoreductase [bacterium]
MTDKKCFLVTGGLGCIGAETTKWLLKNTTANVVICGRDVRPARVARVFHDITRTRLKVIAVDVANEQLISDTIQNEGITHVIHLAALQTPDCNQHRDLGMQINLGGTQNLIEALKRHRSQIERFVFASSIAVYGPRAFYPEGLVPVDAVPNPVNVYGAWKLAGENITRIFNEETGIDSISLRPGVLFGPGRDAGLTSSPTTALKSVALGIPFEIPFCNRQDYLYAPDVGAAFGHATLGHFTGYSAFTLPSHTVNTSRFVSSIKSASKTLGIKSQCSLRIGKQVVPFICDLAYDTFHSAFPNAPHTDLDAAVLASLRTFQQQTERGWLSTDTIQ